MGQKCVRRESRRVNRPSEVGATIADLEDAERAARDFCRTIQEKILALPDHVEVFPTHVAGSLCGGNIGSRYSTTVGYERRTNAVLSKVDSTEGFVEACIALDDLPAVPPYWRRMRSQNLDGVALLGVLGEPPALQPDEVEKAMGELPGKLGRTPTDVEIADKLQCPVNKVTQAQDIERRRLPVSLDQFMVNVGDDDIKVGDEVVLLGDGITVEDLAEWAGTSEYEVMTNISARIPRIFLNE